MAALQSESGTSSKSIASRMPGIIRLLAENIDEETDELILVEKPDVRPPCITTVFYTLLPHYLQDSKNSLAFCRQMSFTPVNQKHIVFRVFRV